MSILFELERMERLAEDLDRLRRPVRIPVSCYKRMEGKKKGSPWCSTLDWEDCSIEEPWACLDSHRWYRTTVEIPPHLDGAHVEFLITTGREGQWDATNPQMLFYLNGNIVQGVDVNHREILISSGAKAGERYDIAILAYSGSVPGDLIIRTELVRVDDAVEKAYYDFLVPVQAVYSIVYSFIFHQLHIITHCRSPPRYYCRLSVLLRRWPEHLSLRSTLLLPPHLQIPPGLR